MLLFQASLPAARDAVGRTERGLVKLDVGRHISVPALQVCCQ